MSDTIKRPSFVEIINRDDNLIYTNKGDSMMGYDILITDLSKRGKIMKTEKQYKELTLREFTKAANMYESSDNCLLSDFQNCLSLSAFLA